MSKKIIWLISLALMLGLVSTGYGDGNVIGDWENTDDGWYLDASAPAGSSITYSDTVGVTEGSYSLRLDMPGGGWRQGLVIALQTHRELLDQFSNSGKFQIDVTRLVADWTGQPADGHSGVHFIVNAGGDGWSIWDDYGYKGWWKWDQGDQTQTIEWDYSPSLAKIDFDNFWWLELWLVMNYDGAYTTGGVYYLDNARLPLENKASYPNPADRQRDVQRDPILSWKPGKAAVTHDIFFGPNMIDVSNASKDNLAGAASVTYQSLDVNNYQPGILELAQTYYWRVDEVNGTDVWPGDIWSFTVGEFLVVDDFESYNDLNPDQPGSKRILDNWIDGYGTATNGALVGNEFPPYAEQTIVHGGAQSMPLFYDNNLKYSEATLTLTDQRDWTAEGVGELSIQFRGYPGYRGAFVEAPAGTYTITGSGADITGQSDEFHYAYITISGPGSMIAKVESVENTNSWAKAGVMIRNTLEPGSAHAMAFITPTEGVVFEHRISDGTDNIGATAQETGISAPHWVKMERDISGRFTASHSADGVNWQEIAGSSNATVQMNKDVYIGLAVTSHNAAQTCDAVFSNTKTTGTVGAQWAHQDIGIPANDAEPLYVVVTDTAGTTAEIAHVDPNAAQIDIWTPWVIPLQDIEAMGVDLTNVDQLTLGLGIRGETTRVGGSGEMFFDDIRLYRIPKPPENIWLEAEAADTITAPLNIYDDPTASGGKYIGTDVGSGDVTANPPTDGVATYTFTVAGGIYKILLNVVIPPGDNNSFWVHIPGATYNRTVHSSGWIRFNDIPDGTEWHWDEVHSSEDGNQRVEITLPAGTYTLQIARREETALLDAILITSDLDIDEATLPAVIP